MSKWWDREVIVPSRRKFAVYTLYQFLMGFFVGCILRSFI